MKALTSRFESFITAMLGNLTPTGRVWARVGIVVLIVAAAMSWDFGSSVSLKHAAFLAALTFVAAFGPEAAYKAWEQRKYGSAIAIAIICAPLLVIEFYSHAGYTAGLRGSNVETAVVQNTKFDARQDEIKEGRASLAMWERRLAELESQNAWVTTVTADALRAQLASANLAIEQEAAKGGCKARCLARTKERDELAAKIALAEEKSTLTKNIEATKRVLAEARDKAAVTEHKSSSVVHQNQFLARAVALVGYQSLEPSKTIETATEQSASIMMALAGTGLPAFCLFVAGLYRREEDISPAAEHKPIALVRSAADQFPPQQSHVMKTLRALAA